MTPIRIFSEDILILQRSVQLEWAKKFAGLGNHAEDDDAVYLWQCFSIRNCYGCYLCEISSNIKTYGDGSQEGSTCAVDYFLLDLEERLRSY